MTDSASIERDLAFSIQAARDAGARLAGLRQSGRWEDETLGDVGDQAADGFLRGLLEGRYPEDGVLSEETVDSPERLERERVWIVDPLDGTKEYRQLREDWAVHVALTIGGRCALGAVALPARDTVVWGVALPGQERGGIEGAGALETGAGEGPAEGPRIIVSRSHTPPWVERFAEILGASELIPCGSAGYKACELLLGRADIYVHKIGLKEWDTCAPETVARSLGWSVSRLGGAEHRYNQRDPHNHELVICRPALTGRVVAGLAEAGARDD